VEQAAAHRRQAGAARRLVPGPVAPGSRPWDTAVLPGGAPRAPAGPRPASGARTEAEAAACRTAPRRLPVRHSVRHQVLSALRDALMAGELEPGEVYSAPVLAEQFGVSATPVREAMQLLAREGVVEAVPNRGFRVAERSPRDLAELAEIRALLEVPVLLRLARTVPAERWQTLWPLVNSGLSAAAVGDRSAYAEADRAFHRALLELSGNSQLTGICDELYHRAQWPRTALDAVNTGTHSAVPAGAHTGTPCPGRPSAHTGAGAGAPPAVARLVRDANEHALLVEALSAADIVTAERVLRCHYGAAAL
jgi:DNA-binding GntR family transcriptional regulator